MENPKIEKYRKRDIRILIIYYNSIYLYLYTIEIILSIDTMFLYHFSIVIGI